MTNVAESQNIFINQDASGNLEITWTIPECVDAKSSWKDEFGVAQPFEFKYKKSSALSWEDPIYSDGSGVYIPASALNDGTEYKFKVKYFGLREDCKGIIYHVRTLGTELYQYNFNSQVVNPPTGDLSGFVRIHNISHGKCIYPYTPGGISDLRMHNWACWSDPSMAFTVVPTSPLYPDQVRLKSEATGLCMRPINSINYESITAGSCTSGNTVFEIQDMGADTFRLKNLSNNMCLYGSPDDGGYIRQFGCWNNPDMLFEFLPY